MSTAFGMRRPWKLAVLMPLLLPVFFCSPGWSQTDEATETKREQVESLPTNPMMLRYDVAVGQPHTDFVLPAIDDRRPVRLSDFRGRKVLLINFASW